MLLLDGKRLAILKTQELQARISKLHYQPTCHIIQVGNLFESNKYIRNKMAKAQELGIAITLAQFADPTISEAALISHIHTKLQTSSRRSHLGIIVQLPLPEHISKQRVLDAIASECDIDGLSQANMDNFYKNQPAMIPATARAVLMLLQAYKINLVNQRIVVVGESNLVGRPTKHLLSRFTPFISSRNRASGLHGCEQADVLVVAAGSPHLIQPEHVKRGATVVDVGINTLDNHKVVGDVDFAALQNHAGALSPTPGGVGPLTVISLFENLIEKCERAERLEF